MLTSRQIQPFLFYNALNEIRNQPSLPQDVTRMIVMRALLQHVSFARLKEAEEIIKEDPTLLLSAHASDVMTPSGLVLKNVTPYECALGGGDPEMAAMMLPYFSCLESGEKEKEIQYEKYRPHIENMLIQKPYDLMWLLDIFERSSDQDILQELNHSLLSNSELHSALKTFRNDFKPKELTVPGMHFNYQSLYHAYWIYDQLSEFMVDNKCSLFYTQVIGFQLRNLPARDRQIYARGLFEVITNYAQAGRTFESVNHEGQVFPITAYDYSKCGLGFDFYITLHGYFHKSRPLHPFLKKDCSQFKSYIEKKYQDYQTDTVRHFCRFK